MDGFNVIPVDKDSPKSVTSSTSPVFDPNFEIVDEEKEKTKIKTGISWWFVLSILSLVGSLAYFGFLVLYRVDALAQVAESSQALKNISEKNITKKEMEEFAAMDLSLKAINGKLNNHVLTSSIFSTVNQNIRSSLQVSEYRVDVKEKVVEVNLVAVTPSFKELAEQTEKFFEMKEKGDIQSFSVSNLSFEAETKRAKFSVNIIFDKSKVTANNLNI